MFKAPPACSFVSEAKGKKNSIRRKKRKGVSKKRKPKQQQRAVVNNNNELTSELIQLNNPAHKEGFLKLLGLNPISETGEHVNLDELSNSLTEIHLSSGEESDLDLEVVCCPLDIPEIYEEITNKRHPSRISLGSLLNTVNKSRSSKKLSSPLTDLDTNSCTTATILKSKAKLNTTQFSRRLAATPRSNNNSIKSLSRCFHTEAPPRKQIKITIKGKSQLNGSLDSTREVPKWNSVEVPSSIQALKRKLSLLHTELKFV